MDSISPEQEQALIAAALAVRKHAYAPFSGFLVGSAVLDDRGKVFVGANIENSSYGLTICAERVAAPAAISDGGKAIHAVAVATTPIAKPCGACRQFLYEFGPQMAVLLIDAQTGELTERTTLDKLLPGGFRLNHVS